MRTQVLRLCETGALAALLTLAGCHKIDSSSSAGDPADANLAAVSDSVSDNSAGAPHYGNAIAPANTAASATPARVSNSTRTRPSAGTTQRSDQGAYQDASQGAVPPPPPEDSGYNQPSPATNSSYDNGAYADEYAGTPGYADTNYDQATYAEAPPPELPEYQQPPCPGDNYLWTPGYWNYAQTGYFWVPGVWVTAPFTGALWTPGYWGHQGSRYHFHHGYWGPHIGFYGGIPYGSGYSGHGYEGGYWNHDRFFYNRAVTRIDNRDVHNTYVHNVVISNNGSRASFNGGRGGIEDRPAPYELAAAREQHFAALPVQRQHMEQAMTDRAQFAAVNGGRPQVLVAAHPLAVSTVVSPGNLRPVFNQGGFERPAHVDTTGGQPRPRDQQEMQQRVPLNQQSNLDRNDPQRAPFTRQTGIVQSSAPANQQLDRQHEGDAQPSVQDQQRVQMAEARARQAVQLDRQREQGERQLTVQSVQAGGQRAPFDHQRENGSQQQIPQHGLRLQQGVQINPARGQLNQPIVQQDQRIVQQQENQQRVQQQENQQRMQQQENQQRMQPEQQLGVQQEQQKQREQQPRIEQPKQAAPQPEQHSTPSQAPHAEAPHSSGGEAPHAGGGHGH